MKIFYSPAYDDEIFLGDRPDAMGVIYVGNIGLLDQLKLRAGMPMSPKAEVEREADYLNALNKHCQSTIFKDSLTVDPFGVAKSILFWRDQLIMAGWDLKCDDSNLYKLKILAETEPDFHAIGTADCWALICKEYETNNHLSGVVESIQIDCPWNEIPYLIQKTLKSIQAQNTELVITTNSDAVMPELDIQNIKMVKFPDVNDAYEWFAKIKELPQNTVIINRDNVLLNHILYTWDKPLVQSSLHDSNPQLLQLFKLCMSIFSRPLNIQNLVSYLQLPLSPIPSRLCHQLVKLLLKKGGFGDKVTCEDGVERDEWNALIDAFEFTNNEGKATPQARAKKLPFITPIRADYSNGISKKDLMNYIDALKKWTRGHYSKDDNLDETLLKQMHEFDAYLNSFETALSAQPEIVKFDEIEKFIRQIYRPMNYSLQKTELSAYNVVNDICAMAKPANTLIWLDCHSDDLEKDSFDFLSTTEKEYLKQNGVSIPDFTQHLKNVRVQRLSKLNMIKGNKVFVCSAYNGTERLGEHSMVAEINYAFNKKGQKVAMSNANEIFKMADTTTTENNIDHFKPQQYIELGNIEYKGRKESNTSLDTLINFPFDYVVEHVAKLPAPDEEQLKSVYITLGLVAHHFFQHIIEDANKDLTKMRNLVDKEFSARLQASIDATGLLLLLPENTTQLNTFTRQLKESILTLINIMEMLHLTPEGCEINLPNGDGELTLDGIGNFGARIDFLLKKGDKFVVFDFKWSYSQRYEKNIQNNISIQLELYKETVKANYKDSEIAGVGYYLMPFQKLITSDFKDPAGSNSILTVEKSDDSSLFEKIKNSYAFRMNELRKGHIEEGETMDFLETEDSYAAHTINDNLCVVTEKKKNRKKEIIADIKQSKEIFRASKKIIHKDQNLEPSEIATSHPILKGRLK